MARLENKVAIITGASAGIGRASALLFAREGAKLVVGARRQGELDSLVAEVTAAGSEAVALAGDVRSADYARALVEKAVSTFGKLDIAFNNAGVLGGMGPTHELSDEGWNEAIEINLTAAFHAAQHQIPAIAAAGGGSVIFTSTMVGYSFSFPGTAAYSASKAGLVGLTQALSTEYGPQGVRVNALLPGGTDTQMYREMNNTAEARNYIIGLHALKRVAQPEELARAALYLASDDSSFVTGTASLVDGGASITR